MTSEQNDPLKNFNRFEIYKFIKENPRSTVPELVVALNLSRAVVEHHILILCRENMLVREEGYPRRYTENNGSVTECARPEALLRDTAYLMLIEKLGGGNAVQSDIVDELSRLGYPRSSTKYRLKRLCQFNMLMTWKQAGRRWYKLNDNPEQLGNSENI